MIFPTHTFLLSALMFATCHDCGENQHIVIHSINKSFLINFLPVIHEHIYGKTLNGPAQLYSPKQFEVVGSRSHSFVNQWLCGLFFLARSQGRTSYPLGALQLEVVSMKTSVKTYSPGVVRIKCRKWHKPVSFSAATYSSCLYARPPPPLPLLRNGWSTAAGPHCLD